MVQINNFYKLSPNKHKQIETKKNTPPTKHNSTNNYDKNLNRSKLSFGCTYCVIVGLRNDPKYGKLLGINQAQLNEPQNASIVSEGLALHSAKQNPPVPFSASTTTGFRNYNQLINQNISDSTRTAFNNSIIRLLSSNLDNERFNMYADSIDKGINTGKFAETVFDNKNPGIWFLSPSSTKRNWFDSKDVEHESPIEGLEDAIDKIDHRILDKIKEKHLSSDLLVHSVSFEDKKNFENQNQVVPFYSAVFTTFNHRQGKDPVLVIDGVAQKPGMDGTDSNLAAIERTISLAVDPDAKIGGRPEKFHIFIPKRTLEKLSNEQIDYLKRPNLNQQELTDLTVNIHKKLQKMINQNISIEADLSEDKIESERKKTIIAMLATYDRDPAKGYPPELCNFFKQATLKHNSARGLGFREVNGENLVLDIDINNKEQIEALLSNIRTGLTSGRSLSKGKNGVSYDKAFK